ncbi:MAG: DUF1640 domain-containing protein [Methylococcales bacterium]|nr:DUF1640 domain-containing protein [Methylococcales bacterium]
MSATVLNIHEFYNELKSVGFNEQQAELIANLHSKTATAAVEQAKHDYKLDEVATKRDLKELELQLSIQIEKSRADTTALIIRLGFLQIALITAMLLKLVGMF